MASCTSCGIESRNLLEVFPGDNILRKLPFCTDCVSMGACELPFVFERGLKPPEILQRVVRVNRAALNEVRAARADVSNLEARIEMLEKTLRIENGA